jgi:hypothetical protein
MPTLAERGKPALTPMEPRLTPPEIVDCLRSLPAPWLSSGQE